MRIYKQDISLNMIHSSPGFKSIDIMLTNRNCLGDIVYWSSYHFWGSWKEILKKVVDHSFWEESKYGETNLPYRIVNRMLINFKDNFLQNEKKETS